MARNVAAQFDESEIDPLILNAVHAWNAIPGVTTGWSCQGNDRSETDPATLDIVRAWVTANGYEGGEASVKVWEVLHHDWDTLALILGRQPKYHDIEPDCPAYIGFIRMPRAIVRRIVKLINDGAFPAISFSISPPRPLDGKRLMNLESTGDNTAFRIQALALARVLRQGGTP